MSHKRNTTKQSAGLSQPTLSFQSRRPTTNAKATTKKPAAVAVAATAARKPASAEPPARTRAAKVPEVIEVPDDERDVLDPNGKEWDKLYKEAKVEMGGQAPIHAGPQTSKVTNILRVFDMTTKYGPCAGITRLERWERAKKWGLNPPEEIKKILLTEQGEDNVAFRESILYGWV